jgi:hypothetical protein
LDGTDSIRDGVAGSASAGMLIFCSFDNSIVAQLDHVRQQTEPHHTEFVFLSVKGRDLNAASFRRVPILWDKLKASLSEEYINLIFDSA